MPGFNMNKYLEHLKEDKLVYYIYQSGLSIYDISSDNLEYIVIVDKNYTVPKEFEDSTYKTYDWLPIKFGVNYENANFKFFEMQE